MQFPEPFVQHMRGLLGAGYDLFYTAHSETPPVSVRMNPQKPAELFPGYTNVPWANGGRYLPARIPFTPDPYFHAGCYYVQEASSMFLEHVFRTVIPGGESLRVLDLCAAPGGKSTHLLDLLPAGSLLVSNEVVPSRNSVLRHNIMKWGRSNVVVTQNDPAAFERLNGFFDVILVDAPCSGEGLFRRQPEAISEWSPAVVRQCAVRQQRILGELTGALKQNGFLIYSTCTFEPDENDHQVERLVDEFGFERVSIAHPYPGIVSTNSGLAFYPHLVRGEGYYLSVLRKRTDQAEVKIRKEPARISYPKGVAEYLLEPNAFVPFRKEDYLFAFPRFCAPEIRMLLETVYVRQAGLLLGTMAGTDFIPAHNLALSVEKNPDIASAELNIDDAVRYLKCAMPASLRIDRGFHLVTYNGHALGWVKGLGNRVNNYYPKEYRILRD